MRLNERQLLSALQRFKVETYGNVISRNEMKDILLNFGYTVYAGQKRLVVRPEEGSRNHVYKIAYSMEGLMDNINAIMTSAKLRELAADGIITQDDLNLFAKAELIDNDPYIIKCEYVTNFDEEQTFLQWCQTVGKSEYPGMNITELFPIYVTRDAQLTADANRAQEILARHFMVSDATIAKEPTNHGLIALNGITRLCCLDIGSIVPKVYNELGQEQNLGCNVCHEKLVYTPYQLTVGMNIAEISKLEGVYGCTNPNCSHFYGNINKNVRDMTIMETHIWNTYLEVFAHEIAQNRAIFGFWYLPPYRCTTYPDYIHAMQQDLNITISNDVALACYKNYILKTAGDILRVTPELKQMVREQAYMQQIPTYTDWYQRIVNIMAKYGMTTIDPSMLQLMALTYLDVLTGQDTDAATYEMILSCQDYNSFHSQVHGYGVSTEDANYIFQHLHAE